MLSLGYCAEEVLKNARTKIAKNALIVRTIEPELKRVLFAPCYYP